MPGFTGGFLPFFSAVLTIIQRFYEDDLRNGGNWFDSRQILIDVGSDYAASWCIKYNEKNPKLMYFGEKFDSFT